MKHYSKILLVSILTFLGGAAIVSTFLSIADIEASKIDSLKEIHTKLIQVELQISKVKPICEQLDQLRLQREELVNESNQIINSPNVSPNVEKPPEKVASLQSNFESYLKIEPSISDSVDLDKLAFAVAWSETHNCELGYGKMYNNCFGIKNGSIAPCEKIGQNNMCIYDAPEESYLAFKRVWQYGYGNRFPTYRDAQVYTGSDSPRSWLSNVSAKYNE